MRAIGYVRVSLEEQGDGYSPDAQEHAIEEYVAGRGWELVEFCRGRRHEWALRRDQPQGRGLPASP